MLKDPGNSSLRLEPVRQLMAAIYSDSDAWSRNGTSSVGPSLTMG